MSTFNYGNLGIVMPQSFTGIVDLLKNAFDSVVFTQYIPTLFFGILLTRMLNSRGQAKQCFVCQQSLEKNKKSFAGMKEKIHDYIEYFMWVLEKKGEITNLEKRIKEEILKRNSEIIVI